MRGGCGRRGERSRWVGLSMSGVGKRERGGGAGVRGGW